MKPERFVEELTTIFKKHASPKNALAMSKYMKNLFSFYGINKPLRTEITKPLFAKVKESVSEEWINKTARLLWLKSEREYHYIAMELYHKNKKLLTPKSLATIEKLLVTHSWWDTVDGLTNYAISPLIFKYPDLKPIMKNYSVCENQWLKRVSIIFQLPYKEKTDALLLFAICKKNAGNSDFFIKKAIGWALRQYAKTNPKPVYAFVKSNEIRLSNLSIREALKHKL